MQLSKPLFWFITLLWFIAGTWWYSSCSKCSTCSSPALPTPTVTTDANASLPGFSVSDSNWTLSSADNLRFGKSGNLPVMSGAITSTLDSLVLYAKNHPNKTLTVTGHYSADEKNTSSFDNLGLARADEMKKWLVAKGLNAAMIKTESVLDGSLRFAPADTLVGGISMVFNGVAVPVKDDLFGPRTVYFNTGKNTLAVDAELETYLTKANEYLKTHTDKKLTVIGHTDNVGNADKNMLLSANRAAFVKDELVKKGIDASKIESSGKGINEPTAENTTADGRAKNRRVTIQLQ